MVTDLKRVSESLEFDPIDPNGKIDVMARDARPQARDMLKELALLMGEMTAQDMAEERAEATRAMVRPSMKGMAGEEFGRRLIRQAPAGPNRAARSAAAARAQRGA